MKKFPSRLRIPADILTLLKEAFEKELISLENDPKYLKWLIERREFPFSGWAKKRLRKIELSC